MNLHFRRVLVLYARILYEYGICLVSCSRGKRHLIRRHRNNPTAKSAVGTLFYGALYPGAIPLKYWTISFTVCSLEAEAT